MLARLASLFRENAWLQVLAVGLLFLLLDPQPVPLPLVEDLRTGHALMQAGEAAAGASRLSRAAARQPWNGALALEAGLAELAAGSPEVARRHLLTAAALRGNDPHLRLALGDAYDALGHPAAALAQWEAARASLPAEATLQEDTLQRLAGAYLHLGQWDQEARALEDLLVYRPEDVAIRYRLALISAAVNPSTAVSSLEAVAVRSPDLAPAASDLATAIRQALLQDDPAYLYGVVGVHLLRLEEYALAATSLRQATLLNNAYADAHAYLGLALELQGDDGLPAYQTAVELAPDSPLAHAMLGIHWRRTGRARLAVRELRSAFALDPDNPAIAAELGAAYLSLSDFETAERWYRVATELAPENADFWLLLARFYVDNEITVRLSGLPAARQAVALDPESASASDVLGHALLITGDLSGAEELLSRALDLQPDLAAAHYHLGLLRVAQNRPSDARAEFSLALQLDPEGPHSALARRALATLNR